MFSGDRGNAAPVSLYFFSILNELYHRSAYRRSPVTNAQLPPPPAATTTRILNELYPDEAIDAFLTEQGAIPLGCITRLSSGLRVAP